MQALEGWIRAIIGLLFCGVCVGVTFILLIPLIPWHRRRIELTSHLGTVMGSGVMKLSGCKLEIEGLEHARSGRPAVFIGNHTSIYDAFTSIWLSPLGTVGVAKKQIIYYPFYGMAWLLAGHLTVDRGNSEKARASMRKMGDFVRDQNLSIFLWPEGTRARDGRLLPFKKGAIHLALQTGLPIVPMVTTGAHQAWLKGTLTLRKVPIKIRFLPPIDTSTWTRERLDEHLEDVYQTVLQSLPEDQRPLAPATRAAA